MKGLKRESEADTQAEINGIRTKRGRKMIDREKSPVPDQPQRKTIKIGAPKIEGVTNSANLALLPGPPRPSLFLTLSLSLCSPGVLGGPHRCNRHQSPTCKL